MKNWIFVILTSISALLAGIGFVLLMLGLFSNSKNDMLYLYVYGGLAGLISAAILYGYAYIVQASIIYCEKFFHRHDDDNQYD